MSKGYTIQFFINEINTKVKSSYNAHNFVNAISPIYGNQSVKIQTLNSLVGNFNKVANGIGKYAGYGKTPKSRVLKALRLRKKLGFFS